jgi:hypothetical protein
MYKHHFHLQKNTKNNNMSETNINNLY